MIRIKSKLVKQPDGLWEHEITHTGINNMTSLLEDNLWVFVNSLSCELDMDNIKIKIFNIPKPGIGIYDRKHYKQFVWGEKQRIILGLTTLMNQIEDTTRANIGDRKRWIDQIKFKIEDIKKHLRQLTQEEYNEHHILQSEYLDRVMEKKEYRTLYNQMEQIKGNVIYDD